MYRTLFVVYVVFNEVYLLAFGTSVWLRLVVSWRVLLYNKVLYLLYINSDLYLRCLYSTNNFLE